MPTEPSGKDAAIASKAAADMVMRIIGPLSSPAAGYRRTRLARTDGGAFRSGTLGSSFASAERSGSRRGARGNLSSLDGFRPASGLRRLNGHRRLSRCCSVRS
jgi:hypothetical protein